MAPNPIDFDKVFAAFGNLAETGNFVVLSTVCVILGLYVIALVFARREDKQDELRVSMKSMFLMEINSGAPRCRVQGAWTSTNSKKDTLRAKYSAHKI